MGYYINETTKGETLDPQGKIKDLLEDGAKIVKAEFQPNLICVVDNGMFQAAGYCYSKEEFEEFNNQRDNRSKTWLVHPKAAELSGYKK
ncbi:MAG: hypothetical protein PHF86_01100 [Candidatus Nanoarchaeia archaeon]|nr:hypothetical protein [Candidatus Nanoarchaeia archaeon]